MKKKNNVYKYHFVYDKTPKSQKLKKTFKKFKNHSPKKTDIIIVAGGDGFMLHALKKLYKFKKPFYGINCGTIGFLMNRFEKVSLNKIIRKTKSFTINPLEIKVFNTNRKKFKMLAINEISLFRQSRQTTILNLKINGKKLIKKLVADGVLVSTPAGSTAYNLSVRGPILSLNSKKLAVTPISPFRPRRWKGKILSDKAKIFIKNIDPVKRPVSAVADNYEIRNIKNIKIVSNKKINFNILFNSKESLLKKIRLEQKKSNII
tara:strand:+ start:1349 stop:2134 length:786 start_codon:yes stop_codon:yes gene_type:complete